MHQLVYSIFLLFSKNKASRNRTDPMSEITLRLLCFNVIILLQLKDGKTLPQEAQEANEVTIRNSINLDKDVGAESSTELSQRIGLQISSKEFRRNMCFYKLQN